MKARTPTQLRDGEALAFSIKAAVAGVLAVLLFGFTGMPGGIWAAVSAVIVTEPSMHPSVRTSTMRVTANLIGAVVGSAISMALGHQLWALALGVVATGMICHYTRLDDALRPAYSAVVIVIMNFDPHEWYGSLDRVLAVFLGCVCALAVGFAGDEITRLFKPEPKENTEVNEGNE